MKNYKLEFIRGFAAFLVFLTHIIVSKLFLYSSVLGGFSNWGTESVIAFFILSGVVIAMSYEKNKTGFKEFVSRRLLRLYPLLIISLIIAFLVSYFLLSQKVSLSAIIGNLLLLGTLDGKILPVPDSIIPIWSLSFEIFFYIIFSFIFLVRNEKYIYIWLALSLLAIPFYYKNYEGISGYLISHLAFSTPWIIGYLAYKFAPKLNFVTIQDALFFSALLPAVARLKITQESYCIIKYDILSFVALPIFIYAINFEHHCIKRNVIQTKNFIKLITFSIIVLALYFFSEARQIAKVIYVLLPILMILIGGWLITILMSIKTYIIKISFFLGSISYGLYIIHFPILLVLSSLIENVYLFLLFGTLFSFLAAYFLEKKFQPFIVKKIRNKKGI